MVAPALLVAVPLLAGILFGSAHLVATRLVVSVLLASWLAALGGLVWRARVAGAVSLVAGCLAAGVLLGSHAQRAAERPTLLAWTDVHGRDRPVHLTGVLREDAAAGSSVVSLTL